MWVYKKDGTKAEHWIDLIWLDGDENDQSYWWEECAVKWDGCIHYNKARNIPFEKGLDSGHKDREKKGACDDYFHICDIDELINKLIELKKVAQTHFTDKEYCNEEI